MIAERLGVILVAWLVGGIPFGFLIAKSRGMDIREHGSGNIGATNVTRVLGKKLGILCFIFDAGKGFLPVFIATRLSADDPARWPAWLAATAVLATVAGHVWTPYLGFKGGKGIATSAGALIGIAPLPLVIALLIWLGTFFTSRYVSLASIVAAASLPLSGLALRQWTPAPFGNLPTSTLILLSVVGLLTIVRHSSNIRRLLDGTENRFERKPKESTET
jgi:glycerol-3-phosphate acyltransferase PlsY